MEYIIVFSTNMEPKELVDEAFLRRIPYKIEIIDPTEQEFRQLMKLMCERLGVEHVDFCLAQREHAMDQLLLGG